MTKWTAEKLEEQFRQTARIRIRDKKKGDKRYSDDSTYWEGGFCNWGANHSLYEDCNSLVKFFNKTNELKEASKKIIKSAGGREEFDSKIKELSKQADEIITELGKVKENIGGNSSIGGICIIWNEYLGFVEKKVDNLRKEVERVKRDILQSTYDNAKELRSLQIEEKKIKKETEELTENIENETDESKKAQLILLLEENKKKYKENLEKQKQNPVFKLGNDFNPDEHIQEIIDGMRQKAMDKKNRKSRKQISKEDPNNSEQDSSSDDENSSNNNIPNNSNSSENQNPDWFQNNQPLIILGAIAILFIFYFYTHQEEEPNYYDF